ncbi:MAG: 5-formyltetrahydrofolate cyclo-ligase [Candidatus Bipolaricaulia bacterium]
MADDNDARTEKARIRAEMRAELETLDPDQKTDYDQRILERVMSLPSFQTASQVFCYLPLATEVNTMPLVDMLLDVHGAAYVPVTDREAHTLRVAEIVSSDELIEGTYGVSEPAEPRFVDPTAIDLWIMPGLAFDERGVRIGQGAGYFDAFFGAHATSGLKVALAYAFQVVADVPARNDDVPVDLIVTENDHLICGQPDG